MDKEVVVAIIGGISAIIATVITWTLKEQSSRVRVKESIEKTAHETAERIAQIGRLNYNELQEDLATARTEINNLRQRQDLQTKSIDSLYSRLGRQRDYIDALRQQLIQAGVIPLPFDDNPGG